MSACIRFLYSSDQWAPGFRLDLPCGRGTAAGRSSTGALRGATLSFNVARGEEGGGGGSELSMQFLGTKWEGYGNAEPILPKPMRRIQNPAAGQSRTGTGR